MQNVNEVIAPNANQPMTLRVIKINLSNQAEVQLSHQNHKLFFHQT